jgi:uncharacterized membrane protein
VFRKWNLKSAAKLAIIVIVSLAYLGWAIRSAGVWAGVLFVVIWVAVFVYQRSRSHGRQP